MASNFGRISGVLGWPSSWRDPSEFVLQNGLRVVFAQRQRSPVVELRLVINGGYRSDPDGRSGLAGLAVAMLIEHLLSLGDAKISIALDKLGAVLQGQLTPDAAVIGMSAFDSNLDDALGIFFVALARAEFRLEDVELLRARQLGLIASERLSPMELASRVLPPMVYGPGHVYARPLSGSGNAGDVATITDYDLRSYYARHINPQTSTLIVAGSCQAADLCDLLEKTSDGWRAVPFAEVTAAATEKFDNPNSVTIVNRPGSSQTALAAALSTFERNSTSAEALIVADTLLGGMFTSRLNLSLRESKGWTYGLRSELIDARRQGLWLIRSAVRADRAAPAIAEIADEIKNLAGHRPPTCEEFTRAVDYLVARIAANHETCAQMADAFAHHTIYWLPTTYPRNLASCLRRLKLDDVMQTCREILAAGQPRWMVVGEAAQLVDQLRPIISGEFAVVDFNSSELP